MAKVYLINIKDIKEESVLPSNVDEKMVLLALKEATDLELEPLVSKEYLEGLNQGIINKNLSDKDKEVIRDYIKPFLIYATLFYVIPLLHNKVNNKGVNVSTDATLTASAPKYVDSFQQMVNQRFDSYKRRLINFFKSDNDDSTNSNPLADTTGASTGFYIPDAYDDGEKYYKARASKTNYYYNRGY